MSKSSQEPQADKKRKSFPSEVITGVGLFGLLLGSLGSLLWHASNLHDHESAKRMVEAYRSMNFSEDNVEPDLRAYAANGVAAFSQFFENPETIPWKGMNINGLPALQCTARGELNNVRYVFLTTYVDTGDCFCTIQACAVPSQFEKYCMELETITNTFCRVEGGNQ